MVSYFVNITITGEKSSPLYTFRTTKQMHMCASILLPESLKDNELNSVAF